MPAPVGPGNPGDHGHPPPEIADAADRAGDRALKPTLGAWLTVVGLAADLAAWLRLLALPEALEACEPKALRYGILCVPARPTTGVRRLAAPIVTTSAFCPPTRMRGARTAPSAVRRPARLGCLR